MSQIDLKNATVKIKDASGFWLEVKIGEGTLSYSEKKNRIYRRNLGRLSSVSNGDQEGLDVSFEFVWEQVKNQHSLGLFYSGGGVARLSGWPDPTHAHKSLPSSTTFSSSTMDGDYPVTLIAGTLVRFGTGSSSTPAIDIDPGSVWRIRGQGTLIVAETILTQGDPFALIGPSNFQLAFGHTSTSCPPFGSLQFIPNNPTIEEVLRQVGSASGWVTTDQDPCQPYCVDLEITYDPQCSGVESETILLPKFRYEEINHDLRGAVVACRGKCNVEEAEITRG